MNHLYDGCRNIDFYLWRREIEGNGSLGRLAGYNEPSGAGLVCEFILNYDDL
jgi:hypothetical protein